ncbi:fungal-specific transcription factor domain-containing protein [Aspergillus recurvatus]
MQISLSAEAELNYACQYERKVKKRGPKPRLPPSNQQAKRSVNTSVRPRTYPSPASTESGEGQGVDDRPSRCANPDWNESGSCPEIRLSAPGGCSSSNVYHPLFLEKVSSQVWGSHITSCSFFPLDLSPIAMPSDRLSGFPTCRYPCLNPVLPLLQGTITADDACELLDIFFTYSETPGPITSCPYVLSPIIRRQSLLRETNPRPVSTALLAIILWCVSHTANLGLFLDSNARARVTQRLYCLSMKLLRARDCDTWRQAGADSLAAGDWVALSDMPLYGTGVDPAPSPDHDGTPEQNVDDVLSYVLLTCVVSGTEFKDECLKWWNKAVRLVKRLGFGSEARIAEYTPSSQHMSLAAREEHEERRRTFWLVYALDRHLALSFNKPLHIVDSECQVLCPLPERIWQGLDNTLWEDIPARIIGPPTHITGTSFFEYLLPLMTILGHIIQLRSRNQHARLGGFDESYLTGAIEALLADFQPLPVASSDELLTLPNSASLFDDPASRANTPNPEARTTEVAVAYGQYMVRVLQMLLHVRGGPVTTDVVDASCAPLACAAHAIDAADAVDRILNLDKDLSFIPFVFGTYLFQGSLTFLPLVHQLRRVGAMDLAKQGCKAVLRAHEVMLKTLDTSFQVRDSSIAKGG